MLKLKTMLLKDQFFMIEIKKGRTKESLDFKQNL